MSLNTGTIVAEPLVEEANASAVSWGAIFAGAFAAVAITAILIELGIGLGLSSTSAWPNTGASIASLGVAGAIWLIVVQWIASAVGGYISGRLRSKWVGVHTDEVFFRDTAHGFLAWCVATVIGVVVIAMIAASVLHAGGRALGGAAQGAAIGGVAAASRSGPGARMNGPMGMMGDGYYVDTLFRPAPGAGSNVASAPPATPPSGTATDQGLNASPAGNGAPAASAPAAPASGSPAPMMGGRANDRGGDYRGEATRIFVRDLPNGGVTPEDRAYLAQLISAHTGMSQAEAQKRVDDTVAQVKAAEQKARDAAEKARKATASGSIIGALAMLVGAFIAAVAGAMGGRLRDEYGTLVLRD